MKLRDLIKTNSVNDGTRMLVESILAPEVLTTFKKFKKECNSNFVLIGGLALSFYVKPRYTSDIDLIFLKNVDIPSELDGFKRHRNGAFLDKTTHVEIEVLTPQYINLPMDIAEQIFKTAIQVEGIKIASVAGLIVSKLSRFSRQDQADIESLILFKHDVDLSDFNIPEKWIERFNSIKDTI